MSIHNSFAEAQYISRVSDIVKDHGIVIEIGSDFDRYANHISTYRQQLALGRAFDPGLSRLDHKNGFWIAGWDQAGNLVHSQAMRRIDMHGRRLSDYLGRNFQKFAPPGVALDMSNSRYHAGPGARRITGDVCYHGDLWVSPSDRYRGSGLPGILARFALASCLLRWSPDHVFGFMAEHHAFRGLAEREGYMHCEPGALVLQPMGAAPPIRGFLTYMSREDLHHLLKICPDTFIAAQAA